MDPLSERPVILIGKEAPYIVVGSPHPPAPPPVGTPPPSSMDRRILQGSTDLNDQVWARYLYYLGRYDAINHLITGQSEFMSMTEFAAHAVAVEEDNELDVLEKEGLEEISDDLRPFTSFHI